MSYLIVPLRSRMASFRDPDFQNFHRTLPLPPPSTCIGMAGAALGLGPEAAQEFFAEGEWSIGIGGHSAGMATDLWKYDDFKIGGILLREYLYGNRYYLAFGHEDDELIERLQSAFADPTYALTCGNSDSLATVDTHGMTVTDTVNERSKIANCYVAGDLVEAVISAGLEGDRDFSIRTTSVPVAQDLPVRFDYNKGIRMLRQRRLISYVRYPTELPESVRGVTFTAKNDGDVFLPLFPL